MLTRILLLLLASVLLSPAWSAAPSPPNILLFLADDLGWADVPWHGSTYRMPNLERLAREGIKLEAHYVHPMCTPTRAALMTGRFASRFGVTGAQNARALPWGTVTLARALRTAGYDTALIGKWHLGSRPEEGPQQFGFDHGYGSLAGGVTPHTHLYKKGEFTRTWHRNGQLIEEEGHVTDLIAQEAVQWLEDRNAKPFFLYVPFTAIHVPLEEDEKWQQMNAHLPDPAERLRAACASHLDDAVGQILGALDRQGLREKTLVIFLSDNGAHRPSPNQGGPYPGDFGSLRVGNDNKPLRGHKGSVYEGGIRTPGVVSWPGKLQRGEIHAPLHAADWMPTLCALAGAEPAPELKWDGLNIWPALERPGTKLPERTIYSAGVGFRSAAVRHGDWKLVVTTPQGRRENTVPGEELFNLGTDPGERTDLAADQPEKLVEMRRRLKEAAARDRDAVATD